MSLELDFLEALAKQPGMQATPTKVAYALGWPSKFLGSDYRELQLAIVEALERRGLVRWVHKDPSSHSSVRLVGPGDAVRSDAV